METSYLYSVSRVNTLAQYLLTKTDIERLLVAKPGADLQSALKETYLAPYVMQVKSGDIADAIEQTLIDAKKLIHRIAPNGDMFRVLWVQYDIHNLRVFAKARVKNLSLEECAPYLSERGIYDTAVLFEATENNSLNNLQPHWQEAFSASVAHAVAGELDKVDGVLDALFFTTLTRISNTLGDAFIKTYVAGLIDMYNVKSRLRTLRYPDANFASQFVLGGVLTSEMLENEDTIFAALERLSNASFWQSALEVYRESGNTTQLDARAEEYLVSIAKKASVDMFSSASLVLYYLLCKQAAANVRTIVVGKNSGMNDETIRHNLRLTYVTE